MDIFEQSISAQLHQTIDTDEGTKKMKNCGKWCLIVFLSFLVYCSFHHTFANVAYFIINELVDKVYFLI